MTEQAINDGANLGFEARLWAAADKLRGNMEPSDHKHVVPGMIFLKYISDAIEAKRGKLPGEELADAEDPEEYLAENIFRVPRDARWSHLQAIAQRRSVLGHLASNDRSVRRSRRESLKRKRSDCQKVN